MSPRELKICVLLWHCPKKGLFASQLIPFAPTLLNRKNIYTTLVRLALKGWVSAAFETDPYNGQTRPRYQLTTKGVGTLMKFMSLMGLEFIPATELKRPEKEASHGS